MKKIKILSLIVICVFTVAIFSSCGTPITKIVFDETEAKIRIDNTYQIKYSVEPEDINNPKITWNTSDDTIATVDSNGLITAVGAGEATITASANNDVSATFNIVVTKVCTETDELLIEGVYIDDSYKDKNASTNKLVCLFYTVKAPQSNIGIDSTGTAITVNGNNTYYSERITNNTDVDDYVKNYYFSDYLKTVNVGENAQVMETFLIPEAELKAGNILTFANTDFETMPELAIEADSITACENGKELASKADPEGYAVEVKANEKADSEQTNKVRNLINGYYYEFYVNSSYYKVEFSAKNNFEITVKFSGSGLTNEGTYEVRNGYLYLLYGTDDDPSVKVPYELKDGDIDLDLATAFDVKE